ncbi:MAG: PTS sugar transporter subunit IIA [Treponema sp.]|jgi:mannitol/fructose-specific phosphotransferase system IIA component (Ntr-type)|nr:PTS sugar transporter subunit IIA [Treponema sp.]
MRKSLSEIFNLQSIYFDIDGNSKEGFLAGLVDSFPVFHPEYNRTELFTAVMEREAKMNTGIGNGVAIPRAYCKGIGNMSGAIGISKQGIDYGALDNKPVQIVFLLGMDQKTDANNLYTLNLIFKLAQSEKLALMINAKNAEEIHEILSGIH